MRKEMVENPAPRPAAAPRLPAGPVPALAPFRFSPSTLEETSPRNFACRNLSTASASTANSANPACLPRASRQMEKHLSGAQNFFLFGLYPCKSNNHFSFSGLPSYSHTVTVSAFLYGCMAVKLYGCIPVRLAIVNSAPRRRRSAGSSVRIKVLSPNAGSYHVNSSRYAAPGREAAAHRSP
jgi:hypothetical protein